MRHTGSHLLLADPYESKHIIFLALDHYRVYTLHIIPASILNWDLSKSKENAKNIKELIFAKSESEITD